MRTYLGAQVAYNSRRSLLDCLVRNMSQNGAKLVFSIAALIPSEFELLIPQRGGSRLARIVWRNPKEAGVTFLLPQPAALIPIEAARRINKLKTERDALAQRVTQLTDPA
jgi:hypothetical protein